MLICLFLTAFQLFLLLHGYFNGRSIFNKKNFDHLIALFKFAFVELVKVQTGS